MTTQIPREDWKRFLDDLSRQRTEWLTTVELQTGDSVRHILDQRLPLIGITAETRENHEAEIEIIVGGGIENHQTHNVINPLEMFLIRENESPNVELAITDKDNVVTLVRLDEPMPKFVTFAECKTFHASIC